MKPVTVLGVGLTAVFLLGGLTRFPTNEAAADVPKAAAGPGKAAVPLPGRFVHVALYTFKADAPKGVAAAFVADAEKCFQQVPSVRGYRAGPPAGAATPKAWMVGPKGDYHIGVVLCFDDFDGLAQYGAHPRHNELKQKYAKYFDKIVAYDFDG